MSNLLKAFWNPARHEGETAAQPLGFVVRLASNNVIGRGAHIPWWNATQHLFCQGACKEGAFIVGRLAEVALPLLPNAKRKILTASRDTALHQPYDGRRACGLLGEMVGLARIIDSQMPVCLGGSSIFAQLMPQATRILIASIDREVEGDKLFPPIDEELWFQPVAEEVFSAKDTHEYNDVTIRLYVRKAAQ